MFELEVTPLEEGAIPIAENDDEKLSPEGSDRAKAFARMVEDAQARDDNEALKLLADSVRHDPELMEVLERRQAENEKRQETETIDLTKINQALEELVNRFTRIAVLSARAMDGGAVMESLFNNDDERSGVIEKVDALKSAIGSATSYDQVQDALNTFSAWYEKSQSVLVARTRAKVNYFGGSLPGELSAQTRLFEEIKGDIDNIQHYLVLAKE